METLKLKNPRRKESPASVPENPLRKNSLFSTGDVVINFSNQGHEKKIGVLVQKCDLHVNYWKVLCEGDVEIWWEPNLKMLQEENQNE
tara:strand:- start:378 stop:641 length:264 start_codon:yes stop_codon:yes gene_type:complete